LSRIAAETLNLPLDRVRYGAIEDEHPLTLRQADQLRTYVANVKSGIEVIMEQVARLPTRKESATQGDGLGDWDAGEDERARLKRPIAFFDDKALWARLTSWMTRRVMVFTIPNQNSGKGCRHDRTGKPVATLTDRRYGGACWRRSILAARGVSTSEPARQCPTRHAGEHDHHPAARLEPGPPLDLSRPRRHRR
jgi:hypothetical protein